MTPHFESSPRSRKRLLVVYELPCAACGVFGKGQWRDA